MNPTETVEPQPLAFAATTANARGDDPLAAGADDLRAETTKPLSWQGKLPPVALTGRFEAEAMFAAITGKVPNMAAAPLSSGGKRAGVATEDASDALFADGYASSEEVDEENGAGETADKGDDTRGTKRSASPDADGIAIGDFAPAAPERKGVRPAATVPAARPAAAKIPSREGKSSTRVGPAPDTIASAFAMQSAQAVPNISSGPTGAWWTLPLLFAGLAVLACALLVPAADRNRRAAHELAEIRSEVAHFRQQSAVNRDFLARAGSDPVLAERLALRQLRMTRPDARVVQMPKSSNRAGDAYAMSPFAMMSIEPPAPVPAYTPVAGFLTKLFLNPQRQIFLVGLGVMLVATGVIFGGDDKRNAAPVAA